LFIVAELKSNAAQSDSSDDSSAGSDLEDKNDLWMKKTAQVLTTKGQSSAQRKG